MVWQRFEQTAAKATAGELNLLRIERLIDQLACGPLETRVIARKRGGAKIVLELEHGWTFTLWSYWPRTVTFGALRRIYWDVEIGWVVYFDGSDSTNLWDDGVVVAEHGLISVRLICYRLEVREPDRNRPH
jgi:hypothetical protein